MRTFRDLYNLLHGVHFEGIDFINRHHPKADIILNFPSMTIDITFYRKNSEVLSIILSPHTNGLAKVIHPRGTEVIEFTMNKNLDDYIDIPYVRKQIVKIEEYVELWNLRDEEPQDPKEVKRPCGRISKTCPRMELSKSMTGSMIDSGDVQFNPLNLDELPPEVKASFETMTKFFMGKIREDEVPENDEIDFSQKLFKGTLKNIPDVDADTQGEIFSKLRRFFDELHEEYGEETVKRVFGYPIPGTLLEAEGDGLDEIIHLLRKILKNTKRSRRIATQTFRNDKRFNNRILSIIQDKFDNIEEWLDEIQDDVRSGNIHNRSFVKGLFDDDTKSMNREKCDDVVASFKKKVKRATNKNTSNKEKFEKKLDPKLMEELTLDEGKKDLVNKLTNKS